MTFNHLGFKEDLLHQFTTDKHNIFRHSDDSFDYDGYSQIPEHLSGIKEHEDLTGIQEGEEPMINETRQTQDPDLYAKINRKVKQQHGSDDIQDTSNQHNKSSSDTHLYTEVNIKHRNLNQQADPSLHDEETGDNDEYNDGHLYATVIRRKKNNDKPNSTSKLIYQNTFGARVDNKSKPSSYLTQQKHGASDVGQRQQQDGGKEEDHEKLEEEEDDDGFVIDLDELLRQDQEEENKDESSTTLGNGGQYNSNNSSARTTTANNNNMSLSNNLPNDEPSQSDRILIGESYYGDVSSANNEHTTKESSDIESKISRLGKNGETPLWRQGNLRRNSSALYNGNASESNQNDTIPSWKHERNLRKTSTVSTNGNANEFNQNDTVPSWKQGHDLRRTSTASTNGNAT